MRMRSAEGRVLVTPAAIIGARLVGSDGRRLGAISSLVLDEAESRIVFALIGDGGTLGVGEKYIPVPWRLLSWDRERRVYAAPFDKAALDDAPAYDPEQLGRSAYAWSDLSRRHFGVARAIPSETSADRHAGAPDSADDHRRAPGP